MRRRRKRKRKRGQLEVLSRQFVAELKTLMDTYYIILRRRLTQITCDSLPHTPFGLNGEMIEELSDSHAGKSWREKWKIK